MLGIKSSTTPTTGKFAKDIRQQLVRVKTGNLDEQDKTMIHRSAKSLRRYHAVWK